MEKLKNKKTRECQDLNGLKELLKGETREFCKVKIRENNKIYKIIDSIELDSYLVGSSNKKITFAIVSDDICLERYAEVTFDNTIFMGKILGAPKRSSICEKKLNFSECVFYSSIEFKEVELENCEIFFSNSTIIEKSNIDFNEGLLKSSKIQIVSLNGQTVDLLSKGIRMKNSEFSFFNSNNLGKIDFSKSKIIDSNIKFIKNKISAIKVDFEGITVLNSEVKYANNNIHCQELLINNADMNNSKIKFIGENKSKLEIKKNFCIIGSKLLNTNLEISKYKAVVNKMVMNNSIFDGEVLIDRIEFENPATIEFKNSILNGLNNLFSHINNNLGSLSFEESTFNGKIKLEKLFVNSINFIECESNSVFKWNIGEFIVNNEPQKLYFYEDRHRLNYDKTLLNLRSVLNLISYTKSEIEYNYLSYWVNKKEQNRVMKSCPLLKKAQFFIYYLFYGTMTDYFLNWKKVVKSMFSTIFYCSLIYMITGFSEKLSLAFKKKVVLYEYMNLTGLDDFFCRLWKYFCNKFYFSTITFTTVGYGDILPTKIERLVAGIEGVLGVFLFGSLIATLGKRFTLDIKGDRYNK